MCNEIPNALFVNCCNQTQHNNLCRLRLWNRIQKELIGLSPQIFVFSRQYWKTDALFNSVQLNVVLKISRLCILIAW